MASHFNINESKRGLSRQSQDFYSFFFLLPKKRVLHLPNNDISHSIFWCRAKKGFWRICRKVNICYLSSFLSCNKITKKKDIYSCNFIAEENTLRKAWSRSLASINLSISIEAGYGFCILAMYSDGGGHCMWWVIPKKCQYFSKQNKPKKARTHWLQGRIFTV